MRVYILRHGQSISNLTGDTTILDPELTDEGHKQCALAKTFFDSQEIDLVICSTMTRALQTASNIFPHKKIHATDLLVEFNNGVPCNSRHALNTQRIIFSHVNFDKYKTEIDIENDYESSFKRACRIRDLLFDLKECYKSVVLVGHGNTAMALMHVLVGIPGIQVGNCEHNAVDL